MIERIIAGLKQRAMAAIYRAKRQDTYILMLHEVTEGEPAQQPGLSITAENLELLLENAQTKGIEFVHMSDIHTQGQQRRAVLTFDDIFLNACQNAFPLLRQKGIPYTVFITTDYVDQPGFVTSEQLEQLRQDPLCTIGFHANSHRMMRELSNEEILTITDPKSFEEHWGVKCDYFAFPYGSVYACPRRAVRMVAKHGYRGVFSTINAGISAEQICRNARFIPRICVNDAHWKELFNK